MLVGSLDGGWKERGERMSRREIKEKAECWTWSLPLIRNRRLELAKLSSFRYDLLSSVTLEEASLLEKTVMLAEVEEKEDQT